VTNLGTDSRRDICYERQVTVAQDTGGLSSPRLGPFPIQKQT